MAWLASISPATDYDYFSLSLASDTVLDVITSGQPNGDTVVTVFDDTGAIVIGCDDDVDTSGFLRYAQFSCCLPPGNYCVGVKSYANQTEISEYLVEFRYNTSCVADPDPTNNGCPLVDTPNFAGACEPW